MNTDSAMATLRAHPVDLERLGVRHAAVFGSTVRGTCRPDSDVDILIDLDEAVELTVFDYVGIVDFVSDLFSTDADVANRAILKPSIRSRIERAAVFAF